MKLLIYEESEMREILSLVFLLMKMQTSQNGLPISKTYKIIIKIKHHQIIQKLMLVIHCLLLKLLVFWANQLQMIHRAVTRVTIRAVLRMRRKERGHLNVVIRVELLYGSGPLLFSVGSLI